MRQVLERSAVSLDNNKTDEPRPWALSSGVGEALKWWQEARDAKLTDRVLDVPEGDSERLAEALRRHLKKAKVNRTELHEPGTNRRPLRAHDLRGMFVTLALANGKTETWVADRTGHKSSQMINRYRRLSRSATELCLGELQPLTRPCLSCEKPRVGHKVGQTTSRKNPMKEIDS